MGTITAKTSKMTSKHQTKKQRSRANRRRGEKLSALAYATDVLVALVTDGFNTLPVYRYADYVKDLETVKSRIRNEGLYFLTEILPGLATGMFDILEGRSASFPGFTLSGETPAFLKRCFDHAINGEPEYIRFIYQVSVSFKKFEGEYSKEQLVSQYAEFVHVDEELAKVDFFTPELFPIVERARHYCKQFFADFDVYGPETIPRPGPGATNTPIQHKRRYTPSVLYKQLDSAFPYEDWFYHDPIAVVHEKSREFLNLPKVDEPTSRFKFVPKTARKARGICIEENEVQFLQQGVRRAITKHIQRHRLYGRRIVLDDQSVNGWMALQASADRRFATLDMSSASDRIARDLVSWIFQDNVELHNALMALSTKWIEPPPEARRAGYSKLHTNKFAPMGSAVCFPVMSLLFMFLIRAAITKSDAKYPHLLSTNVFVYGDDIVVPSSVYNIVCDCLQAFGLKVNKAKSFVTSYFRESCGVHAYHGMDITPVFVRKLPSKLRLKSLISLVDTEQQLYHKGYYQTSEVLRRYGATIRPRLLHRDSCLYVPLDSDVVGWRRRSAPSYGMNYIPKRMRWNPSLHRHEYKVSTFKCIPDHEQITCDSEAIMRYICMKPESFKSREVKSDLADRVTVRTGWQPRPKIWA